MGKWEAGLEMIIRASLPSSRLVYRAALTASGGVLLILGTVHF